MKRIMLLLLVLCLVPLTASAEIYRSDVCKIEITIPSAWGGSPSMIEIDPKVKNSELLNFDSVGYFLFISAGVDKDLQGNSFAQIANSEYKDMFLTEFKKMKEKAMPNTKVEQISFKKLGVYDVLYLKSSIMEEGKKSMSLEVNILQDGKMYNLILKAAQLDNQAEQQFDGLVASMKNI